MIGRGAVLVYRVFDIAEEVDLKQVEQLLKTDSGRDRLKLARWPRHVVVMRNAPVTFSMGESEISLQGKIVRAETFAKIWDYGVLSIQFQLTIPAEMNWEELIQLSAALEAETSVDSVARLRCQDIVSALKPALRDAHEWAEFEDYVIYFFESLDGVKDPSEVFDRYDVPRLLVGEPSETLAESMRKDILYTVNQYSKSDLTVIDWNSAFVVEPSGRKEVPEVIEFALTHLMEMRYYDQLLDQRLTTLYDAIEATRGKLFSSRFSKIAKESSAMYIELTEFLERVDSSFKVIGDFYLAKIFRSSTEEFRIRDWEENITRKLNLLAQVSKMLQGEVDVSRSLYLEMAVVILISYEVIMTALKWGTH